MDCPVTDFASPVEGTLCYYGEMEPTFAGTFNNVTGSYIHKSNGGVIIEIERGEILTFQGSLTSNPSDQVMNSETVIARVGQLNPVADFVVTSTNFGFGQDVYLIGCQANQVRTLELSTSTYRAFTMMGVNPAGSSGAQWLYVDGSYSDVYCAYNNGNDGVGDLSDFEVVFQCFSQLVQSCGVDTLRRHWHQHQRGLRRYDTRWIGEHVLKDELQRRPELRQCRDLDDRVRGCSRKRMP